MLGTQAFPEPIRNLAVSDEQRRDMSREWAATYLQLRDRLTGRPRLLADEVYGELDTYGGFAAPIVSQEGRWGLQFLYRQETTAYYLVMLAESDSELHPYFDARLSHPTYSEAEKAIYLPPDRLTANWQALVLFHEVLHAAYHRQQKHRDKPDSHWLEEYEVYAQEIVIVRQVYGRQFSTAVLRLSKQFEQGLRANHLRIVDMQAVPETRRYRLFGAGLSDCERGMQRGIVILAALYKALDRMYPDGDKSQHCAITRWFCSANKPEGSSETDP